MARQNTSSPKQYRKRFLPRKNKWQTRPLDSLAIIALLLSTAIYPIYPTTVSAQDSKWDTVIGKQRKRAPTKQVRRAAQDQTREPRGLRFNHRINLNALHSLPSILELSPPEQESSGTRVAQARALLVLDEHLFAAPLRYDPVYEAFVTQFPTPAQTMKYRFQLIRNDGTSILSEEYGANPSCDGALMTLLQNAEETYSGQRELVRQATSVLEEIHRANYILKSIDNLVEEAK